MRKYLLTLIRNHEEEIQLWVYFEYFKGDSEDPGEIIIHSSTRKSQSGEQEDFELYQEDIEQLEQTIFKEFEHEYNEQFEYYNEDR